MNFEEEIVKFQFRSPKLIFQRGIFEEIPQICLKIGNKGALIMGKSFREQSGKLQQLIEGFEKNDINLIEKVKAAGEPSVEEVDSISSELKNENLDFMLGIGGGSTLDLAKAVSGMIKNQGSAADYQKGKDLPNEAIPFIAVPTTAGTGSEITNNAVLINRKENVKLSIRGDSMLAKIAIFDPFLTTSMPPNVTANTGMDALTQAIESYVSKASNHLSDYFAEKAIDLLFHNIESAYNNPEDVSVREKMLYGSLLSALSFSNAKLGAVHGFAHPIGVLHNIPHGLICGVLLPHIMSYNLEGNITEVTDKFAHIAEIMDPHVKSSTKSIHEIGMIAIENIFKLLDHLNIPRTISKLGIGKQDIPAIVADTKGSSLANNPRDTDLESLKDILENAL